MNHVVLAGLVACGGLFAVAGGLTAGETPDDAAVAAALGEARTAAGGLSSEIRGLLLEELKHGGAQSAVLACARSAQERTTAFRQRTGVDIRRVSLRYRNETNAPDAFERQALSGFDRLPVAEREKAEHWQVVSGTNSRELRYLKPVVTNAMCLSCHGPVERLPEGVKAALARAYPADLATGFTAGDVRGALSVRIPLPAVGQP